ncbi:MAG: isoprenylcysteine carboxylmethyltransferase family protein [Candidatus Aminicenantes bacterium]|nr:isoprenylcysteine carboxylmethyltransferase family protein [Candidatus Aminicenantes bacterium]
MSISILFRMVSAAWVASEIVLALLLRSTGTDKAKDKSSLRFLWVTICLSIAIGIAVALRGPGFVRAAFPASAYAGLGLVMSGLVLRWSAILTLRRYFTVDVAIRENHEIVDRGVYRFLRHPAYSGSLLSFFGLAVFFANWLAFIIIFPPILLAFLARIRIEEAVLLAQFGGKYSDYSARAKKLIPLVW